MAKIARHTISKWGLFMRNWGWFGLIFLVIGLGALGLGVFFWVTASVDGAEGDLWIGALVGGLLGVTFSAVGGGFVYFALRNAGRAIGVRDDGEKRSAKVSAHGRTSYRVNEVTQLRLEWRDESGETGHSLHHAPDTLTPYPVGSDITIYADPEGRLPSVWEGDVGPANESYSSRSRSSGNTRKSEKSSTVRRG